MKTVSVSRFKAQLAAHLKEVREQKQELVILDRHTAVAKVQPFVQPGGQLSLRKPSKPWKTPVFVRTSKVSAASLAKALAEVRQAER